MIGTCWYGPEKPRASGSAHLELFWGECSCPELESVGRKEDYGMNFLLCLTRLRSEKGGGREGNGHDAVITTMKEFEHNHSS